MDFLDALRLLWRRRVVVLLGILVTGLACGAVILQVQTVYQTTAQYLLLLPSDATGESNPQSPLINQPAGLVLAGSLIASDVSTKNTLREMVADGYTSDFAVALAPSNGPLLSITVTDTDPEEAVATRDEILRRLDQRLADLQERDIADIPDNQIISALPVAANAEAEAVPGAKIKALVVVVAVGGLLTLFLAFVLDGPLRRRAARRKEKKRVAKAAKAAAQAGADDKAASEGDGAPPVETVAPPAAGDGTGARPGKPTKPAKPRDDRAAASGKAGTSDASGQAGTTGESEKTGDTGETGRSAEPAVRRGR